MDGQHRSVGRRRLRILLAGLGFAACAMTMSLVVVFYGPPYNSMWWGIMAAILGLATLLASLLAPLVDWVIAGYRQDPDG